MTLLAAEGRRLHSTTQQGLRQQLRNLPYVAITEGQRFGGRPH
eukprot:s4222_g10.t1